MEPWQVPLDRRITAEEYPPAGGDISALAAADRAQRRPNASSPRSRSRRLRQTNSTCAGEFIETKKTRLSRMSDAAIRASVGKRDALYLGASRALLDYRNCGARTAILACSIPSKLHIREQRHQ